MKRLKDTNEVAIFKNQKDNAFSLKHVLFDEFTKGIESLDVKTACQDTDICTKVIENNIDKFADFFFFLNTNNCIATLVFPPNLKNADINPVHKKGSRNTDSSNRSLSNLANI